MIIYKKIEEVQGYIPGTRVLKKIRKVEYSTTLEAEGFDPAELVISSAPTSISAHFAGNWDPVAVQTATETRFSGEGSKFSENLRQVVQDWLQGQFVLLMAEKAAAAARADDYAQEIIERM